MTTQTKAPPPEVRGSVRWLLELTPQHAGLLEITVQRPSAKKPTSETYLLLHLREGERLTGWRLRKLTGKDAGVTYDLPADLSRCECPDSEYADRPGGCKHRRAIRAALAAL